MGGRKGRSTLKFFIKKIISHTTILSSPCSASKELEIKKKKKKTDQTDRYQDKSWDQVVKTLS